MKNIFLNIWRKLLSKEKPEPEPRQVYTMTDLRQEWKDYWTRNAEASDAWMIE